MITTESLERKIADFYQYARPSLIAPLRAQGRLDSEADRIIKATARDMAPKVFESVRQRLREAHTESPQAMAILLGSGDHPEGETRAAYLARVVSQKTQQREWIERQVVNDLARLSADDIDIGTP